MPTGSTRPQIPPQVNPAQSSGGRKRAWKSLLITLILLPLSWYLQDLSLDCALDRFRPINEDSYWAGHREEVKNTFVTSWTAYSKYAWGKDRFHPVSRTGSQISPNGLGWMIVDSLDTLMIMNLTSELSHARQWLIDGLTYDQDQKVNTFETTIRMLGGLLSAHYLSTQLPHTSSSWDYVYLAKATDLADRLLSAYETNSGIPFASVNIGQRKGLPSYSYGGASSTAEATSLQLEMKYLAHLTGNEVYWRKAEHVMKVIDDNRMSDGLLPIFVHPHTGDFRCLEIRLGSRGDSYYEYLVKQHLQTFGDEPIYGEMWEEALAGIQKHLVTSTKYSKLQFVAELPRGIGGPLSPKMDHLVCFLPGSIAIGATQGMTETEARKQSWWSTKKEQQMALARELTKTCWAMYDVTNSGLSPEIAWFKADAADLRPLPGIKPRPRSSNYKRSWKRDFVIKPLDAHNLQRPETVESLFLMFRVTENPIYRQWGRAIFKAFQKQTLVSHGEGYTSLDDVRKNPATQRDEMESFWLAETLKYLYLLFSPREFFPLTEIVFNTEAHIFPRFKPTKFKTGWTRKERASF